MYVFGEDLNLKERRTVKSEQLYEVLTHNTRRAFDPEAWAGPNSKTYHLEDGKRLNAFYIYDVANSPKALKTQFDEKGKRFRTPKRLSEGPSYIDLRPFLIQEERQLNQDSRKLNMETKKKVKINEDQVLAAQSSGKKELKRKSHGDDNDSIVVPRDKKKKKTNVPEVIDVKAVKKGTKKKKSGKKDMKAKLEQESKMDEEILKKMAIMTPVLAEGANSVTPQIEGDIIKVDGEPSEKLKKKVSTCICSYRNVFLLMQRYRVPGKSLKGT
ncbi:hypothetical protein FOCC_FOCC002845 [Frankliniella occidentalis]|nr:hypothetical protein FOCC_FOCC002845 [Frankliniella occidentalis]